MFRTQFLVVWLGLILLVQLDGQTRVNLAHQSRNMDFGAAISTRPFKTGTILPSTCQVGESFFKSDAEAGQNLYGCTGINQWSLQAGGGGVGGAGATAALTDLRAVRTSSTVLTVGASCSPALPCNYRMGHMVVAITNPITVTLSSATSAGTVFIYLTATNGIVAGHTSTLTVNCSTGCTPQNGIEQFPDESLPLYRWTANSTVGQWDVTGTDYRAFLSWTPVTAGVGLSRTINPLTGENTLAVDSNIIGTRVSVPATSTSQCVAGNWAADDQFFYVCASTNVWRRVAASSW
jgi:hypothetical protein